MFDVRSEETESFPDSEKVDVGLLILIRSAFDFRPKCQYGAEARMT